MTGDLEGEWRQISFWLWAIAKSCAEQEAAPPIFLLGTHAGAPRECKLDESELQNRLEELQKKIPSLTKQLQPRPAYFLQSKCKWLLLVENSHDDNVTICNLRDCLQRTAKQLVTHPDNWKEEEDNNKRPALSEKFPLPWLQAHGLLSKLGPGFRPVGIFPAIKLLLRFSCCASCLVCGTCIRTDRHLDIWGNSYGLPKGL